MLRHFFYFLSNPKLNEKAVSLSIFEAVKTIVKFILIYYMFVILSMLLVFPILKLLNLVPERSLTISQIPLSFKLIVFVPFYEEVIFRLPLRFSKQNLFLSLSALMFLLFYHTFNTISLICISAVVALIPFFRLIPENFFLEMERICQRYFPFLFYGIALLFGIVHLSNFVNLKIEHYLAFPLLVFNQIVMGLLFGYVRVNYRNGFIYSVLLHLLINLPVLLLSRL